MTIDPAAAYDPNNIFTRILRGEIPCNKVYEVEWALAFHDIAPQAPVHVLVVPKGAYVSWDDFSARAPADATVTASRRRPDLWRISIVKMPSSTSTHASASSAAITTGSSSTLATSKIAW